jgi:lipopolysaccharide export system permease protein
VAHPLRAREGGLTMGQTLQRYFFAQTIRMIFFFLIGIAAIAYMIDFIEFSNRTNRLPSYELKTALWVSAMRVPFILQVALPFIILFATMSTLMVLNRKYELVVARSVGVSAWQFLFPVCAATFFIGLMSVLVVNPLATSGYSQAESVEGQWRSRPTQTLLSRNRPWLRQAGEDGATIMIGGTRVSFRSRRPVLFQAVFIEVDADGLVKRRIDADRAILQENRWLLVDARTNSTEGGVEKRERMALPTNLNETVIQEAIVPAEMIPLFALGEKIEVAKSFGISANPFRMQYHSLVAMPFLLVAMTLIAATVSLRFVRFGQSGGMILGGIGAGFVLYVMTEMTKSFGSAGVIPPVVAAWFPVAVATLFGVAYLLHREDG